MNRKEKILDNLMELDEDWLHLVYTELYSGGGDITYPRKYSFVDCMWQYTDDKDEYDLAKEYEFADSFNEEDEWIALNNEDNKLYSFKHIRDCIPDLEVMADHISKLKNIDDVFYSPINKILLGEI